ncbi:glycosyltransferase [Auraticoccus sp. F435]|uniref:Glycosyltransferase n=1 Tax=Auraticoccus cholistanensis TaxID=2656650 RepID=A0A6A9UX26_9ACTN|nr:glycosyltransferase family 2 protein [Auraticoccus cholistanensis]MVA77261.1 glycosyltransferase [Auraticoccus cholistanensis]
MIPEISILMPTLNEEKSVAAAVRSALQQEGVDVEVLVVDGGSVDRTREIVAEIAAEDPRVRLLDNPRSIIPAALNIGLAAASGEFVARLDAHCSISHDYLRRGVDRLRSDPAMASVGGCRTGVGRGPVGRAIALVLSSPAAIGDSINHFAVTAQLTDHASQAVTRTAAARAVGGWDEQLLVNEDVDFDHRLIRAGHRIGYDPQMRVSWEVRETLPALARQYRRYGRGKGLMTRKNGVGALRARHLVPPAAVVGGAGVLLAGLRRPALWLLVAPYLLLVLAASVQCWRRRPRGEQVSALSLVLGFVVVHGCWGLGFLEGALLGRQPVAASGDARARRSVTAG